MNSRFPAVLRALRSVALAALPVVGGFGNVVTAQAADTEVFFNTLADSFAKPNVLFMLDTSQSMYTVESSLPPDSYNPATTYGGACAAGSYYWATVGGGTPNCAAGGSAPLTATEFNCPTWRSGVDTLGFVTNANTQIQQYHPTASPASQRWKDITQTTLHAVCRANGVNDYNSALVPVVTNQPSWNPNSPPRRAYTFYSGNYLNWLAVGGGSKYRIDLVREVVSRLAQNTNGVKIGLMRYGYEGSRVLAVNTPTACLDQWNPDESTRSGNGAPIVYPVTDVEAAGIATYHVGATVRDQLRYELGVGLDGNVLSYTVDPSLGLGAGQPQRVVPGGGSNCPIPLMVPGGRSPIGQAMFEAYLYYSGQQWSNKGGATVNLGSTYTYPSVASARNGEIYRSPIVDSCTKNYIILLSDGTTEQDNDIDGPVERLPGFEQATGNRRCDDDPYLAAVHSTPPPSQCVDDMAEYMFESDMRAGVAGLNNVITYTVGFKLGTDAFSDAGRSLLQDTATRGGGQFYESQNAQELEEILTEVLRQVLQDNASFSAPAVTVNAFNRTQNLNELYMSLFRPRLDYRWKGNVKKYHIEPDGDIVDASSPAQPAVDPATGFFRPTARSFWSPSTDGFDITAGGAASQMTGWQTRRMYSNLTGNSGVSLTAAANSLSQIPAMADQAAARALLGLNGTESYSVASAVEWLAGRDIMDEDGDSNVGETRQDMGDPLHSRPVAIIYGGTAAQPDIEDGAVFILTNDGFLHAINPVDGSDYWSFVPANLLPRTKTLIDNPATDQDKVSPTRGAGYGLDGNIRVARIDVNSNGIVEPADGDKVYLYFGQRRGGSYLYGMDVTAKAAPRLLWTISSADLPGAGQSWSTPAPAKVRIGTTDTQVLFFGGGYNPGAVGGQDQQPYNADSTGNRIFMVDALTGALLWRAGPTSDSGANLQFATMTNAIAADIRAVDMSGDGRADRLYAADLGGRVWRFDIFNGEIIAGSEGDRLIEGGLFASLGNAEDLVKDQTNTLRFFYAPDPALVTLDGRTIVNIAIGSGHREMPVSDLTTRNWFFSLRDYRVFARLLTSQYLASCPSDPTEPCHQIITEGDLVDLTSVVGDAAGAAVPLGSPGWKFRLEDTGEKVLAESRTFQGNVFFTTYAPTARTVTGDGCGVSFGQNRLYIVSARDARPVNNNDGSTDETPADRVRQLQQGSIAPEVVFIFPSPYDPTSCIGQECRPEPFCLVGLESCGPGFANAPIRTFWRQQGAD